MHECAKEKRTYQKGAFDVAISSLESNKIMNESGKYRKILPSRTFVYNEPRQ